jgi:hypothetical protein
MVVSPRAEWVDGPTGRRRVAVARRSDEPTFFAHALAVTVIPTTGGLD